MAIAPAKDDYNISGSSDYTRKMDVAMGIRDSLNSPRHPSTLSNLAAVTTPSARDWKDSSGMSESGVDPDGSTRSRLDQLPRQAQLADSGQTATGGTDATASIGQLDPAYSRWLMGLPPEFCDCAVTAMRSTRGSRKRSSKRSVKLQGDGRMSPIVWDLGCGRGGWTKGFMKHGFRAIGFDIEKHADYPGEFYQMDIRDLLRSVLRGECSIPYPSVVMASLPCDEFARWAMPWTRKKNPPQPVAALRLIGVSRHIARAVGAQLVIENVKSAQWWLGQASLHYGPFYLWGDGVPALLPQFGNFKKKESYGSKDKAKRAEIPFDLAYFIAGCYVGSADGQKEART